MDYMFGEISEVIFPLSESNVGWRKPINFQILDRLQLNEHISLLRIVVWP